MRKNKKIQSIERVLSAFKGIDIGKIAQVQSYYANKNYDGIKRVLNKPNIQLSTVKAYGRLANQYVAMISEPTIKEINVVKKKYNTTISNDYYDNLYKLKNNIVFKKTKTIKDVMKITDKAKTTTKNNEYRSEFNIKDDKDIHDFINNINLNRSEVNQIRAKGYSKYQILITLLMYSGKEQIVSTKVLIIPELQTIIDFVYQYSGVNLAFHPISPKTNYVTDYLIDIDTIEEIKEIKSIIVRWFK